MLEIAFVAVVGSVVVEILPQKVAGLQLVVEDKRCEHWEEVGGIVGLDKVNEFEMAEEKIEAVVGKAVVVDIQVVGVERMEVDKVVELDHTQAVAA